MVPISPRSFIVQLGHHVSNITSTLFGTVSFGPHGAQKKEQNAFYGLSVIKKVKYKLNNHDLPEALKLINTVLNYVLCVYEYFKNQYVNFTIMGKIGLLITDE